MKRKTRIVIFIGLVLFIAIAGILWIAISGWPPLIIRDHQYRELIANFEHAPIANRVRPGDNDAEWEVHIKVPESQTTVRLHAAAHMGVVKIQYGDESAEHALYKYVDYSSPIEIRVTDRVVYVHWAKTLFDTDHYILAYDIAARRVIIKRRIDPDDLRQSQ